MRWALLSMFMTALTIGCGSSGDVVVYAALDREFSEPILNDFAKDTGLHPVAKYDVESTKTIGLTQAIISEAKPSALRRILEQRDPEHSAIAGEGALGGLSLAVCSGIS